MSEPTVRTDAKEKFLRWTKTHPKTILILVIALLALALVLSFQRQSKLSQQLADAISDLDSAASDLESRQEQLEQMRAALREEKEKKEEKTVITITSDTVKQQLGSLSDLITQEYAYTNADIREESETWIFGLTKPGTKTRLVVTYDGVIKAGIDLSRVQVTVNEERREITVSLPASRITDHNIPQETIDIVEVKNGLFNKISLDDYNAFIGEQKPPMEKKAIDYGLLRKADEEARKLVEALLNAMPGIGSGEDAYKLIIQ